LVELLFVLDSCAKPANGAGEAAAEAWLETLNPQQRAAATHAGGPLLILAGAGTGKTTTLAARVAWLFGQGVAPERIMLLTFTRRAAREMLARVRGLVSLPAAGHGHGVVGGTFHSVAHRFVRAHASAVGLADGFAVLDAGDAADLIDLIREEHGYAQSERRFPRKSTLLDVYSRTVNFQRPLSEVVAQSFPWCEAIVDEVASLFKAYTARKRSLGVLDLDDLLLYWRALAADEVIGPAIEHGIDHILVDEYQDVNGLQVDIVRSLRSRCDDVTAVGDDMQSIYGWRCSSPEHILGFASDFPGASVVTLEHNYRSSQQILDTANSIGAQADRTYRKQLFSSPERGAGGRPELVFCRDETAQATLVCERVLEARERGMDLRAQAVLMRTSHDSAGLELELARRQIPFVKYGGLRYLEAAHVKDLIALFRLVSNPLNELAWFRVLQLIEGVGPVTARRVLDALVAGGGDSSEGVFTRWAEARQRLPTGAQRAGDELVEALAFCAGVELVPASPELAARSPELAARSPELAARSPELAARSPELGARSPVAPGSPVGPGAQAERLRDALAPLIRARYPDGAIRLMDLDQLVAAVRGAPDLGHFAAELAIDPPQSSSDLAGPPHLDDDYLVLSTIHSAKGLEWDAVHLLALYDGNFPACMSAGSSESIEEERRLLYVGVTRARRALHLYVPVRYYHRPQGIDDAHGYGKPSRFLTDEVQRTCSVVRTSDHDGIAGATGAVARRRVTVSVDSLFR
jgi:DNA helicase II / ATP-dependent DNA helicase PcrA